MQVRECQACHMQANFAFQNSLPGFFWNSLAQDNFVSVRNIERTDQQLLEFWLQKSQHTPAQKSHIPIWFFPCSWGHHDLAIGEFPSIPFSHHPTHKVSNHTRIKEEKKTLPYPPLQSQTCNPSCLKASQNLTPPSQIPESFYRPPISLLTFYFAKKGSRFIWLYNKCSKELLEIMTHIIAEKWCPWVKKGAKNDTSNPTSSVSTFLYHVIFQ